jgi:hypothetical protein
MTVETKLHLVDIKAGIRMESTKSKIRYDKGQNDLKKGYWDIFPYISLNGKVNEHINLSAWYKRMIQRPSLMYLNSEIIYIDSLTYAVGNPHLKPAINDNFNFNVNFYKFDLLIGLQFCHNYILWENVPDDSNPNVTVETFNNAKDIYKILNLGISYSFDYPIFNGMISINCNKPNLRMPFRNEIMKLNRPIYFFQTSGSIKILKNTSFNYSFNYTSSGHSQNGYRKSYGYLSSGINQHLMNKKLMISLSVGDIFKQMKSLEYTNYGNNIVSKNYSLRPDSRYVSFRIRYNLVVNKSIQRKTSDTDHIGRLN